MKKLLMAFTLFISSITYAQSYQIFSLYEDDGFITERLLPFAVQDKNGNNISGEVHSIQVDKPCYGMVDPHRAYIIHVYCTEETDTHFKVNIRDNNQSYEMSSPVFHVKKVALVSSTPKPKGGGTDPYSVGRRLFTNNCQSCHKTTPIDKNVTRTILTNAFSGAKMRNGKTTTAMKAFDKDGAGNPFFTNSELDELVKYINEVL